MAGPDTTLRPSTPALEKQKTNPAAEPNFSGLALPKVMRGDFLSYTQLDAAVTDLKMPAELAQKIARIDPKELARNTENGERTINGVAFASRGSELFAAAEGGQVWFKVTRG